MSRYSSEEKKENFQKLAASRTQTVLEKIRILSNCANTQLYDYSDSDVNKIFKAIDNQINIAKARFKKRHRSKFSFDD